MEPPVSVPIASGVIRAATAAADPPLEPPGTRVRSHGLRVIPRAAFSVEPPMANSSMLVLPINTRPASRSLRTTVASYGGTNSASMRELQVVRSPAVHSTSFNATGTPSKGLKARPAARRRSASFAWANARSSPTCRKAPTAPSSRWIWSRQHCVISRALNWPAARPSRSWAAVSSIKDMTLCCH